MLNYSPLTTNDQLRTFDDGLLTTHHSLFVSVRPTTGGRSVWRVKEIAGALRQERITGGRVSGAVGLIWLQCFHGYNFGKGDPKGPAPKDDSLRVFRGGCWRSESIYCRSASRYRGGQASGGVSVGIRLAAAVW